MNDLSKIKILTGTTALLILLNVALIGFMWFNPHAPKKESNRSREDRAAIIIRELKLNDEQRHQFEDLKREHHHIIVAVNNKDKETHEALFCLITAGRDSSAISDSLINEIAANRKAIEQATFRHLIQVRKICTPEQQKAFDDIVVDLFKGRPQGPPPGAGPDGPPPGDRPDHGPE